MKIDKSVDKLSDTLDRIEEEITEEDSSSKKNTSNNTDPELEKLSLMDRYVLKFNWYVENILPYYKAEVMQVHKISEDEYDKRTLEVDELIYIPQQIPSSNPLHARKG